MVSVLKCPIVLLHVILRCPCYVIVFTLKTSWILNPTNIFKKAKSRSRRRLSDLQLSRFDELAAPDSCSWWTRAKPDVLISCCSLSGPGFSVLFEVVVQAVLLWPLLITNSFCTTFNGLNDIANSNKPVSA